MRVVLHIGLHKTGTTFLQACLLRNSEWLSERGIFYKPWGRGQTSHYTIVREFATDSGDLRKGKAALKRLIAEAEDRSSGILLISSEMLCEQRIDIDSFLELLSPYKVSAIAYLRRSDDMVVSAFNQLVRDEHHRRAIPLSEKNRAYDPSYRLLLGRWIRPGVRLALAPYDREQWVGGTVTTDLLSMIGLSDFTGLDVSVRAEDSTPSLPASLVDVLLLANRIPMSEEDHKSFVRDLYDLYRKRPDAYASYDILTKEQREAFRRELADAIHLYRPHFRKGFDESFLSLPE